LPCFAFLLWRARRSRQIAFLAPVAAALAGFAAFDASRFGNPFFTGYEGKFHTPALQGLYRLLLRPHSSYFLFSPVLILALPGWFRLRRRPAGVSAFTAALVVVAVALHCRAYTPEGGSVHGARYLLPMTPFVALAAAAWLVE